MLVELLPVWSMSVVDDGGTSSVMRGTFKPSLSTETYIAALATLATVVQPITGCSIVRYAVTYRLRETDPATARTVLPISPLARFIFTLTDLPDTFAELNIPLDPDWLVEDGPLAGFAIDLTNTEVLSFTDSIRDGIWCDPFAIDLSEVFSAHKMEAP